MKHILFILFIALCPLTAFSQQAQVQKRSKTALLYPEFQEARIQQTFGKFVKAKANIFLKDGSLVYLDEKTGKAMRAYTKNIVGVYFNDTTHFMKVDSVMALVVAQKGYNYLLRNTHVNMTLYKAETDGGTNMDNFYMPDFDIFLNLDSQKRDDEQGIPLSDTYYFNIKGRVIPANESVFKTYVEKDQMQAFKTLMTNRFWSWRDEESLKMLLDFLPQ